MNKKFIVLLIACMMPLFSMAQNDTDTRWGDLGNGTFANPVLHADYSDPDIIRVGNKYYMTCSEFHYMGMPVLESTDMVNWTIVAQVYNQINMDKFRTMQGYGDGTWAPALRYHNGRFYIFVCMPNDGLFMTSAEHAEGPWEPLYQVKNIKGWEDPCPLWDEDGNAWLGRGKVGAGAIIIHRMSPDGKQILDDGKVVYEGPVAEGTKFLKRDGYYYLSIPEGGVGTGWQMVLRSKNIYGPYEGKRVLEQGSTNVNGPHQGALVDTPDGEWWFYHFQDRNPQGRVVHLQPVKWQSDGFPTIGEDVDGNGIGEPMKIVSKPNTGTSEKPHHPQTDDNFNGGKLGIQWQTNHNPQDGCISTSIRKGKLAIKATTAHNLYDAHNQLTQKTMGYKGEVTVKLELRDMTNGQRAGLSCLGSMMAGAGIEKKNNGDTKNISEVYIEMNGMTTAIAQLKSKTKAIWIRLNIDGVNNKQQFSYSTDGKTFTAIGKEFSEKSSGWKGSRVGLYSYTTKENNDGNAFFDDFTYKVDGPGQLK